jgi:hypothetical protein
MDIKMAADPNKKDAGDMFSEGLKSGMSSGTKAKVPTGKVPDLTGSESLSMPVLGDSAMKRKFSVIGGV